MTIILRVAGIIEVVTLTLMLANLATVRIDAVGSTLGPIDGIVYIAVVILSFLQPIHLRRRFLGLLPGVGGLLVLRARERYPMKDTSQQTYW